MPTTAPENPAAELPERRAYITPANRALSALTPVQWAALDLLIDGYTIGEVAKKLRVKQPTVSHWVREDEVFREEFHKSQEEYRKAVVARLTSAARQAVGVASRSLKSRKENARLVASRILLTAAGPNLKPADEQQASGPMFVLPPGTNIGFSIPPVPELPVTAAAVVVDVTARGLSAAAATVAQPADDEAVG